MMVERCDYYSDDECKQALAWEDERRRIELEREKEFERYAYKEYLKEREPK